MLPIFEFCTNHDACQLMAFDDPQPATIPQSDVAMRLHTKMDLVCERAVCLQSISQGFDISERCSYLFVSIKNRQFTRNYIDWFIEMSCKAGNEAVICPVDEPYHFNRMAELGIARLPIDEAQRIQKLAADVSRMAQKAINKSMNDRLRLVPWSEFSDRTPSRFKREVQTAFDSEGLFQQTIIDHVASVKGDLDKAVLRAYAEFFLCEIPVLASALYSKRGSLDVYPGDQADLFWQLELGDFEEELPELTAHVQSGEPLLYMNTMGW